MFFQIVIKHCENRGYVEHCHKVFFYGEVIFNQVKWGYVLSWLFGILSVCLFMSLVPSYGWICVVIIMKFRNSILYN